MSPRDEKSECNSLGATSFILGLVAGTFSAIFCKIAYSMPSYNAHGERKLFVKPISMVFFMFFAMIPPIFYYYYSTKKAFESRKQQITEFYYKVELNQASLSKADPSAELVDSETGELNLPAFYSRFKTKDEAIAYIVTLEQDRENNNNSLKSLLVIPALCDLLCTVFLLIGQVYLTSSLWQLMRSSLLIIIALTKRFYLGHNFKKHMWVGIFIITLAMILVASTSFMKSSDATREGEANDSLYGIFLVILGCSVQSIQYIYEEKVLHEYKVDSLFLIGYEGIWGTILTILFVFPISYLLPGQDEGGRYENHFDTLTLISNSFYLRLFLLAFIITVTIYNCCAIFVTEHLSAMWHSILDAFRPITIWTLGLVLYYSGLGVGEKWVDASYLQLAGLIVLLFGSYFYQGKIYTFDDVEVDITGHPISDPTPADMSTSALTRSPAMTPRTKARRDAAKPTGGFYDSEYELLVKKNQPQTNNMYKSIGNYNKTSHEV